LGPKITLGNPAPPGRPWQKKYTQIEYFTISNCIFKFNFLALVLSEILWGPKFMLGGPVPPVRSLAETFFVPKASTLP